MWVQSWAGGAGTQVVPNADAEAVMPNPRLRCWEGRPGRFTFSGYFCAAVGPGCCSDVFSVSLVLTYALPNFEQEESGRSSLHIVGEDRKRFILKGDPESEAKRYRQVVPLCG